MGLDKKNSLLSVDEVIEAYPGKFAPEEKIFSRIRRGNRIFIGTACGEPQYLVQALISYIKQNPKAFFDAEVLHILTLGVAPYADEKFKRNFRHNSFFIVGNTRNAVNQGLADYTPIYLSKIPDLLRRGIVPVDVALIQTSPPNHHGYMSLGISVDIVKAATEAASLVIAQVNPNMPWVHGDGFIHLDQVDFIIPYEEPVLENRLEPEDEIARQIGRYVARIVQDGDTIQVGYGRMPNAALGNLFQKKHLGVHTELLSDGIVELIKRKVVDNSKKNINVGKTVASFCMGRKETYEFIHNNPDIEFKRIDYTNNPLVIAKHNNMTAINSALEIDLSGQATAESLGKTLYSGIGGLNDFMRGADLSRNGKTILVLRSTARDGTVSRIVPHLQEGARVSLHAGDVRFVVTEYGIAYLHGKNCRERAMELIAIAHPKFRPWLLEEAKRLNLVYKDQAFIPGERGIYPEQLETYRTTRTGLEIFLRPVKISDEPLFKDFYYSLSDVSLHRRFFSMRVDMPHERLQEMVIVDYTKTVLILAVLIKEGKENIVGMGQYVIDEANHTAEVAFVVRDDYQNRGIGKELLTYLTFLARKQGFHVFTAEVLMENKQMLSLFESMGFDIEKRIDQGVYELKMRLGPDGQV